jgi:hypothetical protein
MGGGAPLPLMLLLRYLGGMLKAAAEHAGGGWVVSGCMRETE